MKNLLLIFFTLLLKTAAFANADTSFIETNISLETKTGKLFGTVTTPKKFSKIPVALIIAGSGPTDRDGNNPYAKTANLQKLAYALVENNIASLRFDKRGIGESKNAAKSEADLRFDDYVNDVRDWIKLLRKDNRFSKIIIIGHSEGSLIGMIAANDADEYISISGAGQSADKILREQLSNQPKQVKDTSFAIIDTLMMGKTVGHVNLLLYSLFRPSVQPYLISWFKYDPQIEIKKVKKPILIIQGTNDIQITVADAERLKRADPKVKLVLIKNMNHVFRIVNGDRQENLKTYNDPSIPISDELVKSIVEFIKRY